MTYDDDRTELASALLDGTLPDEAAAAARRDPAVMARLAQLEQARDRVRDVPPPPIEGREAMFAAALDAFDTPPVESPVSELEARRRARGQRRQAPRWLGAAAAVALVLAGVGVVAVLSQQSGDQDNQASVTAADEATEEGGSGDDASADAETSAAAPEVQDSPTTAASRTAPAPLGDLGSFANSTDLVARVRDDALLSQALTEGADTAVSGPGAATTPPVCASGDLPEVLQHQDNAVVALGSATVDGKAVSVWVADTPSGRRVVLVDSDCRTVANRSLE